jgi:hypothetical protein
MVGSTLRRAVLAALLTAAICGTAFASECDVDDIDRAEAPSAEAPADGIEVAGVPSRLWPFYKEYKTLPHYRALVCAGGGMGEPVGCSSVCGANDPRAAIKRATANCKKMMQRNYPISHPPCKLRFIGDIDVSRLKGAKLEEAIPVYEGKLNATNKDLGKRQPPAAPAYAAGFFDGEWQGVMICGSCPTCVGPIEKEVEVTIKDGVFDFVPDLSYTGRGVVDERGHMTIRWSYEMVYGSKAKVTPRNFWFDGSYRDDRFDLKGEREERKCTVTLSRVAPK